MERESMQAMGGRDGDLMRRYFANDQERPGGYSLCPAAEVKGKGDRPVSFVQYTLLDLRIVHVNAAQMFSEELVDKAHVVDLTPCERQIIQHLRISAEYADAADVELLALI